MKTIKKLINRASQKLGLVWYTRPQTYLVTYRAEVTNLLNKENSVNITIPVFLNNSTQKLGSENVFNHPETIVKTEEKYGNKYATLFRDGAPQKTATLSLKNTISVQPQKTQVNPKLKLSDYDKTNSEYQLYIKPDNYLNSELPEIKEIVEKIVGQENNISVISRKLYDYVIEHLGYDQIKLGLYSAKEALTLPGVDCGGFSSLLGALYKHVGIPARIVSGFWAGYDKNKMHAWLEFLTPDNKWVPVDPANDYLARQYRTKKLGGFGEIGSDRIVMSIGQDMQIEARGKIKDVDILQNPIAIAEHGDSSVIVDITFITEK